MRDFLGRHTYLIIWILSLTIIGALAILIFQLNSIIPSAPTAPNLPTTPGTPTIPVIPMPPPLPSVSVFVQKAPAGNSFVVQWQNLPNGTVALDIFRGKTGTDSAEWALWKTVSITSGELGGGSTSFDIGSATEAGYSFYEEAQGGGGGGLNGSSTDTGPIFWTSSSTAPIVTTSTPPNPPNSPGEPDNNPNNPSEPETPSSSPSSSPPSSPSQNLPSNPTSTPPPSGIPYYNPQIQIEVYGNAPGSFWVQHVNQSIQIGWQDIPDGITAITVARSASSTGPWNTILNQENPGSNGSYSLQIVDDTIDNPYYYEMTAQDGTTTVATYGPEYLAGQ